MPLRPQPRVEQMRTSWLANTGHETRVGMSPRGGLRVPSRVSGRKFLWTSWSGAWAGAAFRPVGCRAPRCPLGALCPVPRPTQRSSEPIKLVAWAGRCLSLSPPSQPLWEGPWVMDGPHVTAGDPPPRWGRPRRPPTAGDGLALTASVLPAVEADVCTSALVPGVGDTRVPGPRLPAGHQDALRGSAAWPA